MKWRGESKSERSDCRCACVEELDCPRLFSTISVPLFLLRTPGDFLWWLKLKNEAAVKAQEPPLRPFLGYYCCGLGVSWRVCNYPRTPLSNETTLSAATHTQAHLCISRCIWALGVIFSRFSWTLLWQQTHLLHMDKRIEQNLKKYI